MRSKPLTEKDAQRLAALMNRAIEHEQLCLSRETDAGVMDGILRGPEEWEAYYFVYPDGNVEVDLIVGRNSVDELAGAPRPETRDCCECNRDLTIDAEGGR